MRGFWRGEHFYLSFAELSPKELDHLGVESPLSQQRSSLSYTVEHPRDMNGAKRPQMLLTLKEMAGELRHAKRVQTTLVVDVRNGRSVVRTTSTCLPHNGPFTQLRARCTASNSRQLICQCSWGSIHTPDTACRLNMAPQLVAEESLKTTPEETRGLTTG